jgi:dGTPase
LELGSQPGVEAQIAAAADDIAYHSHDLDDGMRAGFFGPDEIRHLPVVREALAEARLSSLDVPPQRLRHETIRRVINVLISDVVEESRRRLTAMNPDSADRIRRAKKPVVAFSPRMAEANFAIKDFLRARMYRHWKVNRMTNKARRMVEQLFTLLHEDTSTLPDGWRSLAGEGHGAQAAQVVCDYIAGMTDRFAIDEYARLTDLSVQA